MFSFILLLRSAVSYYQDNSWDSDIDDIDEQNEAPADGVNWKSNDDIYNSYPDNMKDVLLLKENPQLYLVTSMNRQRDNMVSYYTLSSTFSPNLRSNDWFVYNLKS